MNMRLSLITVDQVDELQHGNSVKGGQKHSDPENFFSFNLED